MCESEWSWQADNLRKIIHMYMYSITHLVIHNTTINNTHMGLFHALALLPHYIFMCTSCY